MGVRESQEAIGRVKWDALYERLNREGYIREPRVRDRKLPPPIKLAPGVTVSDLVKEQQMSITPWESEPS